MTTNALSELEIGIVSVQISNGPSMDFFKGLSRMLIMSEKGYVSVEMTMRLPGKLKSKKQLVTFFDVNIESDSLVRCEATIQPTLFSRDIDVTCHFDTHARSGNIDFH